MVSTQHVSIPMSSEPVTTLASVKPVICLALLQQISSNILPSFLHSLRRVAATVKNKLQKPSHLEIRRKDETRQAIQPGNCSHAKAGKGCHQHSTSTKQQRAKYQQKQPAYHYVTDAKKLNPAIAKRGPPNANPARDA
ncbi:hypothetical protein PanWU01x14_246070 [Parasponia andersonii]|uniref:Uncharacterized protein n=1 Tax=Parasponia andersonii TaxID=3476 RepID=A0A2P5BEP8_PARAD|nr:hypothetical protein PanWU01x14_246070 [Parasponia andersonii]